MTATPPVDPKLVMKANRKPALNRLTRPDFHPQSSERASAPRTPPKQTGIQWQEVVLTHRQVIEDARRDGKSWPEIGYMLGLDGNAISNAATRLRVGKWDREAVRAFVKGHLPYIRNQREAGASWATICRDLELPLETLRGAAVEFDPGLLTRPSKYLRTKRSHKGPQAQTKDGTLQTPTNPDKPRPRVTTGQI